MPTDRAALRVLPLRLVLSIGWLVTASVSPAVALVAVPSVAVIPGTSPAGGYLSLTAFGVTPTSIGDEEFLPFDVPPFVYTGQTWNHIEVNSNGYIVVGSAIAEDDNCCNLL